MFAMTIISITGTMNPAKNDGWSLPPWLAMSEIPVLGKYWRGLSAMLEYEKFGPEIRQIMMVFGERDDNQWNVSSTVGVPLLMMLAKAFRSRGGQREIATS